MSVFDERIDPGANVSTLVETDECVVLRVADASGEGTMTAHRIFDGAYLMYNDMHLDECVSNFHIQGDAPLLCIEHCREGRIESEFAGGAFSYLQEHEMRVDNRRNHAGRVRFPLRHYHGITIGFDLTVVPPALAAMLGGFSVDLFALREKYCDQDVAYVLRDESGVEHIFSELYRVPARIKRDYYRVKTLELLLYLDALEVDDARCERPYFYRSQVEKVRAARDLMCADLTRHYTLEELARRFDLSLTGMKSCFKGIYGDSMYSYLRRYRMNEAAHLLRTEPRMGIAQVALSVGYENPSKFSAAFKQVMGMTPQEYRRT